MKFRSSILSLAAVSALTATAFMVTGCGSSSSSSGSSTSSTSSTGGTALTGQAAKGFWGGIPYEVHLNGTTNNITGQKTAAGGVFKYNEADNVTFSPGLGITARFNSMPSNNGTTKYFFNADEVKQGTNTVATTDVQLLMENLGTVYAMLGANETAQDLSDDQISAIAAALDKAYADDPTTFAAHNTAQINGFNTMMEKLWTNIGAQGITQDGTAINSTIAAAAQTNFATNLTQFQTDQQTLINTKASDLTLLNKPNVANLANTMIITSGATNNTLWKSLVFDATANADWVNGTMIHNASSSSANGYAKFLFTDGDYSAGKAVNNGTAGENGKYIATLTPYRFTNLSAASIQNSTGNNPGAHFNVTIEGMTFSFYNTTAAGAATGVNTWYNITAGTNKGSIGNWSFNATPGHDTKLVYTIVTNNATCVGSKCDTKNHTIAFGEVPNVDDRSFIGYYWDQAIDLLNPATGRDQVDGMKTDTKATMVDK